MLNEFWIHIYFSLLSFLSSYLNLSLIILSFCPVPPLFFNLHFYVRTFLSSLPSFNILFIIKKSILLVVFSAIIQFSLSPSETPHIPLVHTIFSCLSHIIPLLLLHAYLSNQELRHLVQKEWICLDKVQVTLHLCVSLLCSVSIC